MSPAARGGLTDINYRKRSSVGQGAAADRQPIGVGLGLAVNLQQDPALHHGGIAQGQSANATRAGAMVAPTLLTTGPLTVPVPPRMQFPWTVTVLPAASDPSTRSVPALRAVAPV